MIPEPIIILGSPRSGTSLVASVFAAHGVWVGRALRQSDEWNRHGYFENEMLTEVRLRLGTDQGMPPDLVHDLIADDGYAGGPWLAKHAPPTWLAWRQFKPFWVLVRRNRDSIVASRIRCGQWPHLTETEHQIIVDSDIATLESIMSNIGGAEVWPKPQEGDIAGIQGAIEHCGLEFSRKITDRCIDPSIWHEGNDDHKS